VFVSVTAERHLGDVDTDLLTLCVGGSSGERDARCSKPPTRDPLAWTGLDSGLVALHRLAVGVSPTALRPKKEHAARVCIFGPMGFLCCLTDDFPDTRLWSRAMFQPGQEWNSKNQGRMAHAVHHATTTKSRHVHGARLGRGLCIFVGMPIPIECIPFKADTYTLEGSMQCRAHVY